MITEAETRDWLAAYRQAWVTQDPSRIVAIFTADASYREQRFAPPAAGHDGIRDYWQRNVVERERDIQFEAGQVMVSGDQAFVHWQAHFTWRDSGVVLRLDAIFRLTFSLQSAGGVRLCAGLEEWIDHTGQY